MLPLFPEKIAAVIIMDRCYKLKKHMELEYI